MVRKREKGSEKEADKFMFCLSRGFSSLAFSFLKAYVEFRDPPAHPTRHE